MILGSKRHVCLVAAAWILGIILVYRPPSFGVFLCVSLSCSLGMYFAVNIALCNRKKETVVMCCIAVSVTLTSIFCSSHQKIIYQSIQEQLQNGAEISLTGVLYKKERKADRCLYYLKHPSYGRILVYLEQDDIAIGSAINVKGAVDCFEHAANDGQFDMADYYRTQNISFRLFPTEMKVMESGAFSIKESLYQFQKQISEVFQSELNTRDAGVLNTMVLGNRGMLANEIRELYQDAGISHILAISGLHISILGVSIFRILRKCRCSYLFSAIAGGTVIFCYFVMSGMGVSAQRAFLMYLLMTAAQVAGRTYDPVNALAIAALCVLIHNPAAIFQSGFLFSFLAMTAIVFFIPKNHSTRTVTIYPQKCLKYYILKIVKKVKEKVLAGLILQLFLLPVTAWFFYEVPVCALFLNLLIIPLCSWLLGFGLGGGISGLFFPKSAKWFFVGCHMILDLYDISIGITNRIPFSRVITGRPAPWLVVLYYLIFIAVCLVYRYKTKPSVADVEKRRISYAYAAHLAVFVIFLLMILFPIRDSFQITFLDVGQGDGIYISDGEGKHIMIDGGSTSENEVGKYRMEPFLKYHGVKHIDAWIITHGDYDHYSGFLEVLESGYRVDHLLLAEVMPHDEIWEKLTRAAAENGTGIQYVKAGTRLNLKHCDMQCLYPSDLDQSDDPNDISQIWFFQKDGVSVLFTGDIGEEQERLLMERRLLKDIVVLKAAHHGSKYSSCREFLDMAAPEYTIISCGEKNRYGHPHEETIERLTESRTHIYRTDRSGAVTIRKKKGNYRMESFKSGME